MTSDVSTAPRERPIIFSGMMVRAILAGRKTQTRRVVGSQFLRDGRVRPSPYGKHGDMLWVREKVIARQMMNFLTGDPTDVSVAVYAADDADVVEDMDFNVCPWWRHKGALSPLHMPRWASRITLEITEIRVQRVQEISAEDAVAEGVTVDAGELPRKAFADLWNSVNRGRGYGWEKNPFVWAISFRRVT